MNEQIEIRVKIGEATNDAGLTMSGVIEEEVEVVKRDDYIEPPVLRHLLEAYDLDISN